MAVEEFRLRGRKEAFARSAGRRLHDVTGNNASTKPRQLRAYPATHATSSTPRQPRGRDRSAEFAAVQECGLTGRDGSPQFAHVRVGRSSKLVMRVRFPSPALEMEPARNLRALTGELTPINHDGRLHDPRISSSRLAHESLRA